MLTGAVELGQFAGAIPARWLTDVTFHTPGFYSWAAKYAHEVWKLWTGDRKTWTVPKLAKHFDKAPATIRNAIEIAAGQAGEPSGIKRRDNSDSV